MIDILTIMVALVGAVGVFFGVQLLLAWAAKMRQRSVVAGRSVAFMGDYVNESELPTFGNRLRGWLSQHAFGKRILDLVEQAYLSMPVGALLQRVLFVVLVTLALVLLATQNALFALIACGGELILLYSWLRGRANRRLADFSAQLPEALKSASNAMSAGMSLVQALDEVAKQSRPPISVEFLRVVEDVAIGYDLEEALRRLKQRVLVDELDSLLASVLIQRRSGGNLAELFSNTATLLEADLKLRNELSVLTSQARFSGRIVGLLPVALFLVLTLINPEFTRPLLNTSLGNVILGVAILFVIGGFVVIKRLSEIKM